MKSTLVSIFGILMLTFSAAANAGENPRVAAEIIALVRSQWDAEMKGTALPEQLSTLADDYTEFSHELPVLLSGKALMERFSGAPSDGKTLYSEMLNPKVQVYGDTAVLTYHYLGYFRERDGSMSKSLEKATRVYVRQRGGWMLVHAHFSATAEVK
ncbi:nuclear transport factor 2 family protein [Sphingomonas sp. RB1R13]|uniref:nuclear transport factor 2 family protein n=1 Tax=Sphingomonas sp. RB1R13 TaxID=3096159 RepID=UPI002FC7B051